MIYSSSFSNLFVTLGLTEYSEALSNYVVETLLRPNELHLNNITLPFIRDNQKLLKLILENIKSEDITSNIDNIFTQLFSKNNVIINKTLISSSKTGFLQILVGALVCGLILEVKDQPSVKEADFNFNIN